MAQAHIVKDLFRDEVGGKYSSKKIWGFVVMALVCVSFALDGLHFYKANEALFNTMAIMGTTLIGLNGMKGMFTKNGK